MASSFMYISTQVHTHLIFLESNIITRLHIEWGLYRTTHYNSITIIRVWTVIIVEKELDDTDIPMKFITMQNAKWIVFSLREAVE